MKEPDRPRLWQPVCVACGMLDTTRAAIARHADAADRLGTETWTCPACGEGRALVTRRLEDEDLEEFILRRERGEPDS